MTLKCDNCKKLKCAQAERNCKGFLDAAGKWIGGVVNAAGKSNLVCPIKNLCLSQLDNKSVCKFSPSQSDLIMFSLQENGSKRLSRRSGKP